MKNSKLVWLLLLSSATSVLCMEPVPEVRIEAPVEGGGDGTDPTIEQGKEGDQYGDQDEDGPKDRVNVGNQSGSGRSWRDLSTWFGRRKGLSATTEGVGQDGTGSAIATVSGESSANVAADVERGLKVRMNKDSILTDKDGNIQFEQKKPKVSRAEWWGDVWDRHFSRGRERQEVSALTDKMQELKRELQKTENSEQHEQLLNQLTQVQDRLGRKALDLRRDWGSWKKRSDLQEAQRRSSGGIYRARFNDARQQARVNLLAEDPTVNLMGNSSKGNLQEALGKLDKSLVDLDADGQLDNSQRKLINKKRSALAEEIAKRSEIEGPREGDFGDGLMQMEGDHDTRSRLKKFMHGFVRGVTGAADGAQSLSMYQTGILDTSGEDDTRVQLLAEDPTASRIESASFANLVEAEKVLERRGKVAPLRDDAIEKLRLAQQKRIESLLAQNPMEKTSAQLKEEITKLREIGESYNSSSAPDWYSQPSEEDGASLQDQVDRLISKVDNLSVAKPRDTEMLRMNFDRELEIYQDSRPGSLEEEAARRTLEDYQQELESRYVNKQHVGAIDGENNKAIDRNRSILASDAYKNKILNLDDFGSPIEERQPLSRPTNAMDYGSQDPEESLPEYGPQDNVQPRAEAYRAEQRAAVERALNAIGHTGSVGVRPGEGASAETRADIIKGIEARRARQEGNERGSISSLADISEERLNSHQARVDNDKSGLYGDGTKEGLEQWRRTQEKRLDAQEAARQEEAERVRQQREAQEAEVARIKEQERLAEEAKQRHIDQLTNQLAGDGDGGYYAEGRNDGSSPVIGQGSEESGFGDGSLRSDSGSSGVLSDEQFSGGESPGYTPDTNNQLEAMQELSLRNDPAYLRAQSKIDEYASGKRKRKGVSGRRTKAGFEKKYFQNLNDQQREWLTSEFKQRKEYFDEERRLGGIRGAVRGGRDIQRGLSH